MKKNNNAIFIKLAVAMAAAVCIKVFSLFGGAVEGVYSNGIYPVVATVLRALTGWLPFSLGDVLYAAAVVWLVVQLVKLLRVVFTKKSNWPGFWRGLVKTAIRVLWVYVVFYAGWGLNYSRYGISYQLKLKPAAYTTDELKHITALLRDSVNEKRRTLGAGFAWPENKAVFLMAGSAYDSVARQYSFLRYRCQSVKSSLFVMPDNYFGFLGYYNPFSGEAQVNTSPPPFVTPYTTCHEIAHQVGYASESEANFVGYLAAMASGNTVLQYSAYADLFRYANNELFVRDTAAARGNFRLLDTLAKQDYRSYNKFLLSYKNPVEPLIRMFYGQYLKANNQPKGIETYDEVVAWLIAYEKKYGKI